jgi:hypothetical protein
MASERIVEDPGGFMARKTKDFRRQGFDFAARALEHYRLGQGRDLWLSDNDAARLPTLEQARKINRRRLIDDTLSGKTGQTDIHDNLRRLRSGELPEHQWHGLGSNHWDYATPSPQNGLSWLVPGWGDDESAVALGAHTVSSLGHIQGRRDGDRIQVRVTMDSGLGYNPDEGMFQGEIYDFHAGQPGGYAAQRLEEVGGASPYRMRWQASETFDVVEERGPDGMWRRTEDERRRSTRRKP